MSPPTPTSHFPAAIEARAQAISGMLVSTRLAQAEMVKAGQGVPHLMFPRNRVRLQGVTVQLGDIIRELTYEMRRAEEAAAELADAAAH